MTSVIYIRTSTQEQNPELQLKEVYTIAPNHSIIFEDKQSAWKDHIERPNWNKLYKLILNRKITDLYCWDLDRLYRNRKKLKALFELAKLYKFKIHSYRQTWLNEINKIPLPWNEIFFDVLINIFGWIAEEESTKKSDRIKSAIRKKDNITKSYKGNKWGRKQLSTFKKNQIIKLHQEKFTIRKIAKELGVSVGVVHKIITQFKQKNITNEGSS